MKYVLAEPISAKSTNAAMRGNAQMLVSDRGDPELSPSATQWSLEVKVYVNGSQGTFDVVENLLRSFLAGKFASEANSHFFEQVDGGFVVKLSPKNLQKLGETNRREVEKLQLKLELTYLAIGQEEIFHELICLADFGFSSIFGSFKAIAPLVFCGSLRDKMGAIAPFLRPIKLTLGLSKDCNALDKIAERGFMQPKTPKHRGRSKNKRLHTSFDDEAIDPSLLSLGFRVENVKGDRDEWASAGAFFAEKDFEFRHFVVLDNCGEDLHEPVFFNSLKT